MPYSLTIVAEKIQCAPKNSLFEMILAILSLFFCCCFVLLFVFTMAANARSLYISIFVRFVGMSMCVAPFFGSVFSGGKFLIWHSKW